MTKNAEFLQSIRSGDWKNANALVQEGDLDSQMPTPNRSVPAWLIDIGAPVALVVALLELFVRREAIDPNKLGLLEVCMDISSTSANAFPAFVALMDAGLAANVIDENGETLLQRAVRLNKVREVEVLVRHGADPYQMNVFGRESTSNLEDALNAGNEAGRVAVAAWLSANAITHREAQTGH